MEASHVQVERELELATEPSGTLEGEFVRTASMREHFLAIVRSSLLLKIGLVLVVIAVFLAIFGPIIVPKSTDTGVRTA